MVTVFVWQRHYLGSNLVLSSIYSWFIIGLISWVDIDGSLCSLQTVTGSSLHTCRALCELRWLLCWWVMLLIFLYSYSSLKQGHAFFKSCTITWLKNNHFVVHHICVKCSDCINRKSATITWESDSTTAGLASTLSGGQSWWSTNSKWTAETATVYDVIITTLKLPV